MTRNRWIFWKPILLGSGLLIFILVGLHKLPDDPKSKEVRTDPNAAAYDAAQQLIRGKLKSPSTAKFPSLIWDDAEIHTDRLKDRSYQVSAWVDAQNSFGAKLRKDWICELKEVNTALWRVSGFCGMTDDPEYIRKFARAIAAAQRVGKKRHPATAYKNIHTNNYGTIVDEDGATCVDDFNANHGGGSIELPKGTKVEILAKLEIAEMYVVRTPLSHNPCWIFPEEVDK